MIHNPFFRLSLFALFTLVRPVAAEEESSRKTGSNIRAMLLANGVPNIELFTMVEGNVSAPILVGTRGLSDPFQPDAEDFALVVKDPKAETGFTPVASVTVPTEGKEFILLLEPVGPGQLKAHLVNSKQPRFAADSLLFFNASDVAVGAMLGDRKALIPVRTITIVQAPARIGDVPYYPVTLFQSEKGGPKKFSSTRWPHRSEGRNYIFIYREAASGRLTYRGIDEPISRER